MLSKKFHSNLYEIILKHTETVLYHWNFFSLHNTSCKIFLLYISGHSYFVFCLMFLRQQSISCFWCNSQYWQFSHTVCCVCKLASFTFTVCPLGANVLPVGFIKYDWHIVQYYKGTKMLLALVNQPNCI